MRNLFKIIKENFILLLGTGLFTYGLFSFNSGYYIGIKFKGLPPLLTPYPISTYYYYDSTDLILLTVGAIFIAIGLIKLRTKKDNK